VLGCCLEGPNLWFGLCKGLEYPFCIPLNLISFFADQKKLLHEIDDFQSTNQIEKCRNQRKAKRGNRAIDGSY